eukprot:TRINITY_DN4883_c0_g1_i1.p1 TRINITY_DN4883_c0_g1~~TRINITY_DN4883_c0_g1_i1.p1  ORF type:complete len:287 (+),score=25.32 TRINITY_DN4883_c0_g1_i1:48-863(+)
MAQFTRQEVNELLDNGDYQGALNLAGTNCTPHGETILHLLATHVPKPEHEAIFKEIAAQLCTTMDFERPDYYGATLFYRAALSKNHPMIQLLIELKSDPRQASAFSGKRAIDQYSTYEPLVTYVTMFENRIMENPYANYLYRVAEHYRTSYYALHHPNPNFYQDYPVAPMIKLRKDDWPAIKQMLDRADQAYRYFITNDVPEDRERCLICQSSTRDYCPLCRIVHMCRECVVNFDPIVNQLRQIHVNNCRTGKFNAWALAHPEAESSDSDD